MKWFFDCEFYEDGRTIELISLGLVDESGTRKHYWETTNSYELAHSSEWLQENVLPHLRRYPFVCERSVIAEQLKYVLLENGKPELWAYFSDYDWVAFCQLYGRMIDLPEGFPMFCRDLKQLMDEYGVKRDDLPAQRGAAHDALADAEWNRESYLWIKRGNYGLTEEYG